MGCDQGQFRRVVDLINCCVGALKTLSAFTHWHTRIRTRYTGTYAPAKFITGDNQQLTLVPFCTILECCGISMSYCVIVIMLRCGDLSLVKELWNGLQGVRAVWLKWVT